MTQEDKELLLKDLCARFTYGVKCLLSVHDASITEELKIGGLEWFMSGNLEVKPYLRPMSSMTDKEKHEFDSLGWRVDELDNNTPWNHNSYNVFDGVDWLNAHHFDYRGLIEKGLAIEAKEGMYNLKEK